MSKPKLFTVLESLDLKEMESLRKYLLMYSEPNSNLIALFNQLNTHKRNSELLVDSEAIRLSCLKQLTQKSFLNLCSRMFLQLEHWISIEQMSKDKYLAYLLSVKFYNRRGLFKLADQKSNQLGKLINDDQTWDLEKDKVHYELLHQQYYSDNPIKYAKGGKLLDELTHKFSSHVKHQSILYLCELYNWGRIQSYDYTHHVTQLKSAINALPNDEISDTFIKLKRLISNKEEKDLKELASILYQEKIKIGSDLHIIYSLYLIQYALHIWKSGKNMDLDEISKLYSNCLNSGVLLVDGLIPLPRFHYICSVISLTNSYDFTQTFINKWVSKVNAKDIESVRLIAFAQNCMYHEKEEDILLLIRSLSFEHEESKLRTGALKIISLYKTRDQDLMLLHNQIHNFKIILKRQKVTSNKKYKEGLINFVKIIELLLKSKYKNVEIDFSNYSNLLFKWWLKKQLNKTVIDKPKPTNLEK